MTVELTFEKFMYMYMYVCTLGPGAGALQRSARRLSNAHDVLCREMAAQCAQRMLGAETARWASHDATSLVAVHIYVYLRIRMYMYMYVCTHLYTCICIYVYVHTYIFVYM